MSIIKIKPRSFKSIEHNYEKGVRYRGFGYSSLFIDPLDLAPWGKENYCIFTTFNRVVDKKDSYNQNGAKYIKRWLENESKPIITF